MKINEVTNKIEPSKPRNFVAKNMTTGGAGQHKDKKKAEKQGDVKHKNKQMSQDMSEGSDENPYGYDVGQVVKLRNGKQGVVIDIFDDGIEVLLTNGRTITVDFQDARVLDEESVSEGSKSVNFDGDDLRMLNNIDDLDVLKDAAFRLISNTEGKYPMKPEKVEWFKHHLGEKTNKNAVIKMMYDLLLAGSGMSVVGSKNSMRSNSYRNRFSEEGEPMKIKAVAGNDVTIDQGGQEIKTTADALAPGQQPGTFAMKPTDPNSLKPGATVTTAPTSEENELALLPVAPDDNGIHAETDVDLMGSGQNMDVGGDPTDSYIDQVRDKGFERAARGGREGLAGRHKMSENDELMKMLTIAGLK